jgi:hypothetical protein
VQELSRLQEEYKNQASIPVLIEQAKKLLRDYSGPSKDFKISTLATGINAPITPVATTALGRPFASPLNAPTPSALASTSASASGASPMPKPSTAADVRSPRPHLTSACPLTYVVVLTCLLAAEEVIAATYYSRLTLWAAPA